MFKAKRILVVDVTHGGLTITTKLQEHGAEVTALDLYETLDPSRHKSLNDQGISVKSDIDSDLNYDLIISPFHSPLMNPVLSEDSRIMSHHEITGILLRDTIKDARIIEVTGVKGKTSTASLLTDIFVDGGSKVLYSTSIEVGYRVGEEKTILNAPSITPANAIRVAEIQKEEGIDVDVFIFELSLGFTGAGSTNILTSMKDDYTVAGGRLSAVDCKMYTVGYLRNSILLVDNDTYSKHTGSFSGVETIIYDIDDSKSLNLSSTLFGGEHERNAMAAMTAATYNGIDLKSVKSSLKRSNGIPGRMQRITVSDHTIINNSNPALDSRSLKSAIEEVLKVGEDAEIAVIVGGRKSRCTHTDYQALGGVIEEYSLRCNVCFLYSGEIGRRLIEMGYHGEYIETIDPRSLPDREIVLVAMQGDFNGF